MLGASKSSNDQLLLYVGYCPCGKEEGSKYLPDCYVDSGYWHNCSKCGKVFLLKVLPMPKINPKTQKAKGIALLGELNIHNHLYYSILQSARCLDLLVGTPSLERAVEALKTVKESYSSPSAIFARPCPLTPRHGFVESRVVLTPEGLLEVWHETIAADPDGEVMLMKYIKSDFNIVWTPRLLTIGAGHDGATSGHDTMSFPLMEGTKLSRLWGYGKDEDEGAQLSSADPTLLSSAGIDPVTNDPYIEAVGTFSTGVIVTQLRGGPKVGSCKLDYIPHEVVVSEVLTPTNDDLLEWEKLVQSKAGVRGVVVNKVGGSPVDHFSVHARSFNIPVITTREVSVGETLTPIPTVPITPESILQGLAVGEQFPFPSDNLISRERLLSMSLYALHNSGAFEGEDGFWLGVGAAALLRLGVMALKGEARHLKKRGTSREEVYNDLSTKSLGRLRGMAPGLTHLLRYGNFSGSIGGVKWALCGAATIDLFNAVGRLANAPEKGIGDFLRAYNRVVNQAHNGGWWMNKFTSANTFDLACENHLGFQLTTAPILLEVRGVLRKMTEEQFERAYKTFKSWRPISDTKQVKIKSADINFTPATATLQLHVEDTILDKDFHRPIQIPISSVLEQYRNAVGGDVYVTYDPKGLKLELRIKGKSYPIWVDKPLTGSAFAKEMK